MAWQPKSFMPDEQGATQQGWSPKSFVADDGMAAAGNSVIQRPLTKQDMAMSAVSNPETSLPARLTAYGANAVSKIPGLKEAGSALAASLGAGEGDTFGQRYENLQSAQSAMRGAGRVTDPSATTLGDISGLLLGLGLGGNVATRAASKFAPTAQAGLSAFSKASPYKAGALANLGIGGIQGFADGTDTESRLSGAALTGLGSALLSVPFTYGANNIVAPLVNKIGNSAVGQRVGNFISSKMNAVDDVAAVPSGAQVLSPTAQQVTRDANPVFLKPQAQGGLLNLESSNLAKPVVAPVPSVPQFDKVPTSDQLRGAGGVKYGAIEDSTELSTPEFAGKFFNEVLGKPPKTAAEAVAYRDSPVLAFTKKWEDVLNKPMKPSDVQILDEDLSQRINSFVNPFNGKLEKPGQALFDAQTKLRDMAFAEGGAFKATAEARKIWADSFKLADLEKVKLRAETAQQPAQAIKSGLNNIINNPNRFKKYSKAEQAAIRKAANTGEITDLLKSLGSRLGVIAATAGGASMGGLPGAIAGAVGSQASTSLARRAAGGLEMGKLNELSKMVASPYMKGMNVTPSYLQNLLTPLAADQIKTRAFQ
jgi:hypothetical protein